MKRALAGIVRWPVRIVWRWFTGQPMDGRQRSDAGWFTRGTRMLDPETAPRAPESVAEEIRSDLSKARREWWDLAVRKALRRELRDVEDQVLAEHEHGAGQ